MKSEIENLWDNMDQIQSNDAEVIELVEHGLNCLNRGEIRAAENSADGWLVNEWVKKLIMLYFRVTPSRTMQTGLLDPPSGEVNIYDKVPLKTAGWKEADFKQAGFRMTPGAIIRTGTFIAPSVILLPSFVNIGGYVGEGTMIDTWATIGSCAQIGANCHISGGVGIGGVFEPQNANPVIIEDNVFVGARSEIAEGVIIRKGAVISMGVFLGASTPIVNRMTGQTSYGEIPENAVVLPGSRPIEMSEGGIVNMPCAVIVKIADQKTRDKVGLNQLIRLNSH